METGCTLRYSEKLNSVFTFIPNTYLSRIYRISRHVFNGIIGIYV